MVVKWLAVWEYSINDNNEYNNYPFLANCI